jgi:thioredoxin 1
MHKVHDQSFGSEVIQADRLTIVDFSAEWCGPCKKLTPILQDISTEYGEQIKIVEVDVGEAPATAMKYGVTSIPQLLFFRDGIVKDSLIGLNPRAKIKDKINKHLA